MTDPTDKDIPTPDSFDLDDDSTDTTTEVRTNEDQQPTPTENDDGDDGWFDQSDIEIPDVEIPDIEIPDINVDTDRWANATAQSLRIAGKIPATFGIVTGKTASQLVDITPASWQLYRKLALWSTAKMQKAAGAHAIANVNRGNGREDLRPAKMVDGDEEGKSRGGWKIKGFDDKRYDSSVIGGHSNRLGKADVIHINEDDLEQGTWAETAMNAAIAAGREQYLFRDATLNAYIDVSSVDDPDRINMPDRSAQIDSDADANGETAADGGYQRQLMSVSVERPGIAQDALIPLQSESGYDGQLVSWNSYQNLKKEQADQDQLRNAKNASWVAAKLDDVSKRDMAKLLMIGAAILFMALFHQDIGAFIAGLAGSGGGGGGGGGAGITSALGSLPLLGRRQG